MLSLESSFMDAILWVRQRFCVWHHLEHSAIREKMMKQPFLWLMRHLSVKNAIKIRLPI